MSKERGRRFGLLASFLLCSVLAVGISLWQMSFQETGLLSGIRSWADGCFAAGALWGSLGVLLLVAAFDGFRAMQYLGYTFRFKWSKNQNRKSQHLDSYYEYIQKKKKNEGEGRVVRYFLIPAGVYLAAAVVLTLLHEWMKG